MYIAASTVNALQVGELLGHEDRILHISLSPDQQTIVSAAADETLRFWRCFPLVGGEGTRSSASHSGSYLNTSNQTGEECITPDFNMLRYIR
jgi:WD40 repeat protein